MLHVKDSLKRGPSCGLAEAQQLLVLGPVDDRTIVDMA
jgi:hypothetical protein